MTDKIILTFGSPDNLKQLMTDNADRQFAYLQEDKHEDKFALLDLSGRESIFDYGITLRPFKEVGKIEFRGLIRYESFRLGKHDKELFRKKHPKCWIIAKKTVWLAGCSAPGMTLSNVLSLLHCGLTEIKWMPGVMVRITTTLSNLPPEAHVMTTSRKCTTWQTNKVKLS